MKAMTAIQAQKAWAKNINQMIAFAPNTCPHPLLKFHEDRWILADGSGVLGTGFSLEDCKVMRDTFKRKRG